MVFCISNNKRVRRFLSALFLMVMIFSCNSLLNFGITENLDADEIPIQANAILLRHSTGGYLFNYGLRDYSSNDEVNNPTPGVGDYFTSYNSNNGTNYQIQKRAYPSTPEYGWNNYPYDYWNIFVDNGDEFTFSGQDTLRTLTQDFEVIIWKHCYPGAAILDDTASPTVEDSDKHLNVYKLQYEALKTEMLKYPDNKFIVWTLAVMTESSMINNYPTNSKAFVDWVRDDWDEPGDNIFLWDLYYLETNKESVQYLYYPTSSSDSHPSDDFNNAAGPLFAQRVIDVIRGEGDTKPITGETTLGGDWNLVP